MNNTTDLQYFRSQPSENETYNDWLREWAITIIATKNETGILHEMCRSYYDYCSQVLGIDQQTPTEIESESTYLEHGRAIAPIEAAQCTWQGNRTAKFIQGVDSALLDLKEKFPDKKIKILYAGCGPLAPLCLPILAKHGCKNVEYDCLDIHNYSLNQVKKLAKHFGLEEGINNWIQEDAATVQPPQIKEKYHLIISEVLQQGLQKEPQVAVTINLSNFLTEEGVFVPEEINLILKHNKKKPSAAYSNESQTIGRVFQLSCNAIKNWTAENNVISGEKINIPSPPSNAWEILLFTEIQVYKKVHLLDFECSLNIPIYVENLSTRIKKASFYYVISKSPELKMKALDYHTSNAENEPKKECTDLVPIKFEENTEMLTWIPRFNLKSSNFDQTAYKSKSKTLFHNQTIQTTPLNYLKTKNKHLRQPDLIIFHTSRCGSTLFTKVLEQLDHSAIIAECAITSQLLKKSDSSQKQEMNMMYYKIFLDIHGHDARPDRFFLKVDCDHILQCEYITKHFPNSKKLFLFRNPIEVLVSHEKLPGQSIDLQTKNLSTWEHYGKRPATEFFTESRAITLGEILKAAVAAEVPSLEYKSISEDMIVETLERLEIPISASEKKQIKTAFTTHSKNGDSFIPDSESKRQQATVAIKELSEKLCNQAYQACKNQTIIS